MVSEEKVDKKILVIDIDGTVCPQAKPGEGYDNLEPYPEAVEAINKLYGEGYRIVFHTARFMNWHKGNATNIYREGGYDFTKKQLERWGIKFHELHMGKPLCDLVVDDRSIFYNHDWKQIYSDIKTKLEGAPSLAIGQKENKIKSFEEILRTVNDLKNKGKKVVTTNGSFDILHAGHVNYIEKAKKEGDVLIVLLNSDRSIRASKGEDRPIIPENERARLLAALECVDHVVVFDDDKPLSYLERIRPHVHVKGSISKGEERIFLENLGVKYVTCGIEGGLSTTNVIKTILDRYNNK